MIFELPVSNVQSRKINFPVLNKAVEKERKERILLRSDRVLWDFTTLRIATIRSYRLLEGGTPITKRFSLALFPFPI